MKQIKKYGAVIVHNNKLLLQKEKKHEQLLMPGGKPEKGEDWIQCLTRELMEELKATFDPKSLHYLGKFEDIAADRDARISMELYRLELNNKPKAQEGIKIVWFSKTSKVARLSPVIRNKIWPYLLATRVIE